MLKDMCFGENIGYMIVFVNDVYDTEIIIAQKLQQNGSGCGFRCTEGFCGEKGSFFEFCGIFENFTKCYV